MTDVQQRAAAKHFAEYWKGKGYEKGESQKFWLSLLSDVFGIERVAEAIEFEDQVRLDKTSFIDGYIPSTKVLIEQKSLGKSLTAPIAQSDGSLLSPLQQAQRYVFGLLKEKGRQAIPRWLVLSNFEEFRVYDLDHPQNEAQVIRLENLSEEYYRLTFLVDTKDENLKKEMELSLKAGELVGKIHDRFLEKYNDPMAKHTQRSLNILCVRLVFCLYAEDAGLFGTKDAFSKYIEQYEPKDIRRALIDLFKVLDTPYDQRPDLYLSDELEAFPYVNGGLFQDENIVIPQLTDTLKNILLKSAHFDWAKISPTIFGAVFESTLNPETRRSGGMHYTSIENIHKVIDPLFLDDLKAELVEIKAIAVPAEKTKRLKQYQQKLAKLTFLDPACGSGNFLTETYVSLRRLENEVLLELHKGQIMMEAYVQRKGWTTFEEMQAERKMMQAGHSSLVTDITNRTARMDYLENLLAMYEKYEPYQKINAEYWKLKKAEETNKGKGGFLGFAKKSMAQEYKIQHQTELNTYKMHRSTLKDMIKEPDKKIMPVSWKKELAELSETQKTAKKSATSMVVDLARMEVLSHNRRDLKRMLENESHQKNIERTRKQALE